MINDCRILTFPKIADPRGNLTFIEGERHVPFEVKRVFYLYDVPSDAERGGHALRTCQQVLISLSGTFDVILNDGSQRVRFHLNRATSGLYVPPMIWREMNNFSTGSICLVLASECYDPQAYHRDFEDYLRALGERTR